MKIFLIIIFISFSVFSREEGQTEITTDQGIEVFQNEKYYLLKENVKIKSDEYILTADLVKAYFDKDLYDIVKIECEGNANFEFTNGAKGSGQKVDFSFIDKTIKISGDNSFLIYDDLDMQSNNIIEVNNNKGSFNLFGDQSKLTTDDLKIIGSSIVGKYELINNERQIISLNVNDDKIANIDNNRFNMFAKEAIYSKVNNLIELYENVKIIRNGEIVTGDYARINTLDKSYKITSNKSNKVKLLIETSDE